MRAMTLAPLGATPLSFTSLSVIPAGEPVQLEADTTWSEMGRILVRWRGLTWLISTDDADLKVTAMPGFDLN